MKKRRILQAIPLFALALSGIGTISFTTKNADQYLNEKVEQRSPAIEADTIPQTEFQTGHIDRALNYLNEKEKELKAQLPKIDQTLLRLQLDKTVKQMNFDSLNKKIGEAMSKVDFEKIKSNVSTALAHIDKQKMDEAISRKFSNPGFDKEQLRLRFDEGMKKMDFEKLKIELKDLREGLNLKKSDFKFEIQNMQQGIHNDLFRTRQKLQRLKDASIEMERDGLIEKGPNNRIQYKNGSLYINGQQQPESVSEKYRHYFETRPTRTITVRV